jgi:hypothetical protein
MGRLVGISGTHCTDIGPRVSHIDWTVGDIAQYLSSDQLIDHRSGRSKIVFIGLG